MSTATAWTHMNAWLELRGNQNWYQMLKGYSNERFKQRTVLGVTGQVGKRVATNLKRKKQPFR